MSWERTWILDQTSGDEVDELRAPLVRLAEGGRRLGGDHEDGTHRVDVAVRCFPFGHLQSSDTQTPDGVIYHALIRFQRFLLVL